MNGDTQKGASKRLKEGIDYLAQQISGSPTPTDDAELERIAQYAAQLKILQERLDVVDHHGPKQSGNRTAVSGPRRSA